MNHLETFIHALGSAMHCAQQATAVRWPGVRLASMEVVLAATVEAGDSDATLALRIGRPPRRRDTLHQLSIVVPGDVREAIVVHLDGQLFGQYRRPTDEQAN